MTNLVDLLPQVLTAIGGVACLVSVITEVIKNVALLRRVPTDLVVLVLSIGLTVLGVCAYASYVSIVLTWYIIVGSIVAGFAVAFIAMFGWTKFQELFDRFKR